MIPQYKTKLEIDVKVKRLGWLSNEMFRNEGGLVYNWEYMDMRGHTWASYLDAYEAERYFLELADKSSKTPDEFNEFLENIWDNDEMDSGSLCGLDVGIASLVVALSAMGCGPISSCRAHPDKDYVESPTIMFYARKYAARKLIKYATQSRIVGLVDDNLEENKYGLVIYSTNVTNMINFGQILFQHEGVVHHS